MQDGLRPIAALGAGLRALDLAHELSKQAIPGFYSEQTAQRNSCRAPTAEAGLPGLQLSWRLRHDTGYSCRHILR